MWQSTQKIREHFNRPRLGARTGLFIVGDQGSYYNTIITLNYQPQLWSIQSREQSRLLYYITCFQHSNEVPPRLDAHVVTSPAWPCVASSHVEPQTPLRQPLGSFAWKPPTTLLPYKNIKAYLPDGRRPR
jgi:hypothetical protein